MATVLDYALQNAQHIPAIENGDHYIWADRAFAKAQRTRISKYASRNAASNIFQASGAQALHSVDDQSCHIIDEFVYELNVSFTRTGTASATLPPTCFLLERLELRVGGTAFQTIYPHQIYQQWLLNKTQDSLANMSSQISLDSSTYNGSYSFASESGTTTNVTLYIPFKCMVNEAVYLPACTSDIQLESYWRNAPFETSSGTCTLSLNSSYLLAVGRRFADPVKNFLTDRFRTKDHKCKSIKYVEHSETVQSVTTNQFSFVLNSLNGTYSQLNICMRTSAGTLLQKYEALAATDISLEYAGGDVINYNQIKADLIGNIIPSMQRPFVRALATKNIYPYPLELRPMDKCGYSSGSGSIFTGNRARMYITPNLSGSTDIDVLVNGYQVCEITQRTDGSLSYRDL